MGDNLFTLAGVMGAAVPLGLGMALAAPAPQVAVITGDGELLMDLGALATVASQAQDNLSIVCIDNGGHGETGGQLGHTSQRTRSRPHRRGRGLALGPGHQPTRGDRGGGRIPGRGDRAALAPGPGQGRPAGRLQARPRSRRLPGPVPQRLPRGGLTFLHRDDGHAAGVLLGRGQLDGADIDPPVHVEGVEDAPSATSWGTRISKPA